MTIPRFSILIPAYNAAHTLARALDSLQSQTFGNWECVIVDDGSTDETLSVMEEFSRNDTRITMLRQENAGTAAALNTAARASKGEFLVQLGADDELLPAYCEQTNKLIQDKPDFDIYAANAWQISLSGRKHPFNKGPLFSEITSLPLEDVVLKPCIHGTAAFRREWYFNLGGWRTEIYSEDYDFWLRALAAGARHVYQPLFLSIYHATPNQKTANPLLARESDLGLLHDLAEHPSLSKSQRVLIMNRCVELERTISLRKKLYRIFGKRFTEGSISILRNVREAR